MTHLVRLDVLPSPAISWGICVLHLLAAAVIVYVLPMWPTLGMMLLLAVSAGFNIRRFGHLTSPQSITSLELNGQALRFSTRAGNSLEGVVAPATFVSRYLTIAALEPASGVPLRFALLTVDNASQDGLRQLRVALRWGKREVKEKSS